MRQLFLASSNLLVKDAAQPLLDNYTILVQVLYTYISSKTTRSSIDRVDSRVLQNIPQKIRKIFESVGFNTHKPELCSLMSSCAGRVIAVGKKITKIRPGDFVACSGSGYSSYGDLLLVPSHAVVPLVSREHLKIGSLASVGAHALHSIRQADLHIGDVVCVYGLGLLGQLVTQLARNAGCVVVGIDRLESRREHARAHGAVVVASSIDEAFEKEIALMTEGQKVDATIVTVTTNDSTVLDAAITVTRTKGKIVILSDLTFAHNRESFFSKELELIAAYPRPITQPVCLESAGDNCFYSSDMRWSHLRNMHMFIDHARDKKIELNDILSYEIDSNNVEKGYNAIKADTYYGAVLCYADADKSLLPDIEQKIQAPLVDSEHKGPTYAPAYIPASPDKLRVCMITDSYGETAIMGDNAFDYGKNNVALTYYTIKQLRTNSSVFSCTDSDVLVFDTHDTIPMDFIAQVVRQGVAVFVSGPLCTTFADYEILKEIIALPHAKICTNFYRSLTVPICHISNFLTKKRGPVALYYRVNNPVKETIHKHTRAYCGAALTYSPALCDLFLLLIAHNPVALSVEAVRSGYDDIFPTDNFSVQISFLDGSVCSLLYTTLGNSDMPRERMEVFYDGKTIVLDEFQEVYGYGFSNVLTSSYTDDYKSFNLIGAFLRRIGLENSEPVIPYQRIQIAHYLALVIDELICQGGGNKHVSI